MQKTWLKMIVVILITSLTGCATFTGLGKDNTPPPYALVNYTSQVSPKLIWSIQASHGSGKYYLNFVPAVNANAIFTVGQYGLVTALNVNNGQQYWQNNLGELLVTGPGVGNGVVIVGGANADVIALNQQTGKRLWRITLSDPISTIPVIIGNTAILKTVDGELWAINTASGSVLWQYNHGAPLMELAGGSTPVVVGNKVITGYSDGKLAAYTLNTGQLLWQTTIAQPSGAADVEQMIDIVADPEIFAGTLYVVTYQGNLVAINSSAGQVFWRTPLSSYTGMTISGNIIFVTDAQGVVWAINRLNGQLLWQQPYLQNRVLSAPVATDNSTIVIADHEGYLHWLNQTNGVTVGRVKASDKPILAKPEVIGNQVYVLATNGEVSRFQF
jgi:outer membrane protein assembly factor BamB